MTDSLPHMVPVKSSNVTAVGHDGHRLHVRFRDGAHYSYENVAPAMFNAMLGAESVGGFFHKEIKGKYKHRKHDAASNAA